ncbi:LacI family DNA-binding transcriptional regulator [Stappia stellulata]|uniref:LacI family DNA-binding transcriptional regulator n=1 Tax=Stappia stellulata TaxID=71235 RepID=UPI0004274B6E|nr:LacI family DNA-binding transcriptional regulator [Stappia stellulata]
MEPKSPKSDLPTLEDVARAAGVSTATVSRTLNSPDQVSEGTRSRVMATVRALRYSPNFGARALAAKRTNTYGAVIPTMENAIFARGLEAFQKVLVANGATMLVASSSYDPAIEEDQIRTMVARGADGILLIGTQRDPEIYDFLKERHIPVVIAWTGTGVTALSCVGFDNEDAAGKLAAKAIGLGHRRIAFISAYTRNNDRARDRVAGVRHALATAGLDPCDMPLLETKYSIQCGRDAFVELMHARPRPTLVMCGNDVLAAGAVRAAHELGLDVPADVSITGFDDIELATVISPALTTVHVPHRKMGGLAAEALLAQVRDNSAPKQTTLETHIVVRQSLAPPGSRTNEMAD